LAARLKRLAKKENLTMTNQMLKNFLAHLHHHVAKHNREEGCRMAHSIRGETINGIPGFSYLYDKGAWTWVAPVKGGGILAVYEHDDREMVKEASLDEHFAKLNAELEEYGA
jgi:hypothetical protein